MKIPQSTNRDIARELARKYSTMTHDELDVLESLLVPMRFNKGDFILHEGDVCRNIYYVDFGLVRQFYIKNDREMTEHLGVDHSIFMCIESLFKEEPSKLQVEALEPTSIFAMPKFELERAALHNVNIQMLYRKILEESLILSQVKADMLRFESAQSRYNRFCKMSPQVVLRAPLTFVASILQMTPETLSRVRSQVGFDD
jgi:CRP-like cAMP-binding protein